MQIGIKEREIFNFREMNPFQVLIQLQMIKYLKYMAKRNFRNEEGTVEIVDIKSGENIRKLVMEVFILTEVNLK